MHKGDVKLSSHVRFEGNHAEYSDYHLGRNPPPRAALLRKQGKSKGNGDNENRAFPTVRPCSPDSAPSDFQILSLSFGLDGLLMSHRGKMLFF